MLNIYHGTNPAVFQIEELYGRENVISEIENHVRNRRSIVLMGLEGVGKSSILNSFFNLEFCHKMAVEFRILIRVTDFPIDRDTDGIYQYLTDGVLRSIDALDQEETSYIYIRLRKKCIERIQECEDKASRFQQICEVIQDAGYFITLVIDGFERFVSSPNVKMEHHNLMNTLISKNLSYVVATNYDFNQESLPTLVSGSFLLMKFAGNEVKVRGLSEDVCSVILKEGNFTQEQIHQLRILSGGIPSILRKAAEHTFDQKDNAITDWKKIQNETYSDTKILLERWCKLLSPNQVEVLNIIAEKEFKESTPFPDASLNLAAQSLVDRGILINPIETNTMRVIPGLYKFSTPLLRLYVKEKKLKAQTISNFQAEQERLKNVSILKSMLESQDLQKIDKDRIIELYDAIAIDTGRPRPVNFNASLSDIELQEYELSRVVFERFNTKVKDFITNGIQVDKTFSNVTMIDFAPAYISFAKAIEVHLNETLVPIMKKVSPDEIISYNGRNCKLIDTGHLMLGTIQHVLNRTYEGTGGSFIGNAGIFCDSKVGKFSETWWRKICKKISKIKTSRNEIPHSDFFTREDGKRFLREMFGGQICVCSETQMIYDVLVKKKILS